MYYRIAIISVFVGLVIGSFGLGQGKPTAINRISSNIKMSDHDKIEKLLGEVAELQKEVAALTQKYDTHTHQLRNLDVTHLPGSIECNQTVVRWSPAGTNRESVDRVCRQIMAGSISVMVPGKESTVTGPPHQ